MSGFVRLKPSRKPFPEHLPRERVVVPATFLRVLWVGQAVEGRRGRDETEVIPRRFIR